MFRKAKEWTKDNQFESYAPNYGCESIALRFANSQGKVEAYEEILNLEATE